MILFGFLRAVSIFAMGRAAGGLRNASVLADDSGGAVLSRGEGGVSGTAIAPLDVSPGGKDRRRQLGDGGVLGFLKAERGLKGGDARDLKGDEAFANSAGVGPGGDAEPRGGKDLRPPMGEASDTAGLGGDVSIGRRLEKPVGVCSQGYVQCDNGMAVVNGASVTCASACGDDCCSGNRACDEFTGFVCKDGSCDGQESCIIGNVGYIANSCFGKFSCYGVGHYGGNAGNIVNSCSSDYSCDAAGSYSGTVGDIVDSCSGDRSCLSLGREGGGVGDVLRSCNAQDACLNAFKNPAGKTSENLISCCNEPEGCIRAIEFPTECSPPPPPTPPAPVGNSWAINFMTLGANFSASNDNEHLSLTYSVGTNRTFVTKLYADGCVGAPEKDRPTLNTTEGVIIMTTEGVAPDIFTSNEPMSTLSIDYDINKTLITGSDFWNNETNKIELCQVVQLTENNPNAEDYLVITEDIRNITITFDLSANFTAIVELDSGTINSANETTSVEGYIKAFHCDEDEKELIDVKLVPNDQFNVCITSKDDDVEIANVDSMTIKGSNSAGVDSELAVIGDPNGSVLIPSITSRDYRSATMVLIKTRVPTNLFDYEVVGAKIEVTGSLTIKLKGSRVRKLKLDDGISGGVGTNRKLQGDASEQEATFDLAIKLDPGVSGNEEGITMNSALSVAAGSSIAGFVVFFATAITFW